MKSASQLNTRSLSFFAKMGDLPSNNQLFRPDQLAKTERETQTTLDNCFRNIAHNMDQLFIAFATGKKSVGANSPEEWKRFESKKQLFWETFFLPEENQKDHYQIAAISQRVDNIENFLANQLLSPVNNKDVVIMMFLMLVGIMAGWTATWKFLESKPDFGRCSHDAEIFCAIPAFVAALAGGYLGANGGNEYVAWREHKRLAPQEQYKQYFQPLRQDLKEAKLLSKASRNIRALQNRPNIDHVDHVTQLKLELLKEVKSIDDDSRCLFMAKLDGSYRPPISPDERPSHRCAL